MKFLQLKSNQQSAVSGQQSAVSSKPNFYNTYCLSLIAYCLLLSVFFSPAAFAGDIAECEQAFTGAFDIVDNTFDAYMQRLENKTLSGEDAVETFSRTIEGYNCQLKLVCGVVQNARNESFFDEDQKTQFVSFPEEGCGNEITILNEKGELKSVETSREKILANFFPKKAAESCTNTTPVRQGEFDLFKGCETMRGIKVKMAQAKLAAALKITATRKREGYLLSKLQDLHDKMNPHDEGTEGGGLVALVQKFASRLFEVVNKISCYVPKTVTR